jgi:FKBP-type peptidyl-prolyl cis-trans isomerase
MKNLLVLALLGLALATIAVVVRTGVFARKDPGKPINSAMRQALGAEKPQLSPEDAALIAQQFPAALETASGLRYIVQTPGEGQTLAPGALVTVNYEGRFLSGAKFDSTYDRHEPFTFPVGVGQVVPGWDEAFLSMRKGEKRTLIVPWWLGYGGLGRGPIPPHATLVFEVELLSIR